MKARICKDENTKERTENFFIVSHYSFFSIPDLNGKYPMSITSTPTHNIESPISDIDLTETLLYYLLITQYYYRLVFTF